MAVIAASGVTTAVRLEWQHDSHGRDCNMEIKKTTKGFPIGIGGHSPENVSLPHFSLSKPSFVVRAESNVRKEKWNTPDPPCVVCKGSGRVDCFHCSGKGRTNFVHLAMLPRGEWPKWCKTCGGSGLGYCSRCLGTGEYRYIMGFHFMKRDSDDFQDQHMHQHQEPRTAADQLLNPNA